ncbi:SMODS and SLOG-associating 2TM effector domain-containing protein [Vibrio crassostreae]|uniref:SMODS and SLOG-associating 2TM effector domain-containing protein n=1 Tax=Vibrio splendidus TaxID=29497 RepID=A0AB35N5V5_VIBSP|nr:MULTISPECIES: hypothetical protein [Vibrio]MDP2503790.1 hypothetical protein [Vibrio splendidus]PTO71537.1 hypothetical protein CWN84_24060 [Vibrio splendidus]TDW03568.1 hypothetical protein EDB45_12629 [Vibrio crassostreae]CAK1695586.1 SMODS and SLOG-associating 2TM effector domain-containing protein [Vibrio crassostreae]CAK1964728.1 SMODS and SLOG-associating 2TM effector domain-containing protein [Vibrio crassostreae]
MSDEIRREFITRIEDLKAHISNRYNALNLEAIWLFVATLGCWSVDQIHLQIVALILVLVFFSSKVSKDKKYDTTFIQILKDIRADIENSVLEGDTKKARLHELEEINSNLLGLKSMYKSTPMFLMGYGFWAISFFMFGSRMLTGLVN